MTDHASIRYEDGMCVIRLPMSDVHSLRVALAECPCRAAKSIPTQNIRKRLAGGLRAVEKMKVANA